MWDAQESNRSNANFAQNEQCRKEQGMRSIAWTSRCNLINLLCFPQLALSCCKLPQSNIMDKVVVDIRILAVHLGKKFRFVNLQIKIQQYWGDWVCSFSLEQHIGCQIVLFENDRITKSRWACSRVESVQFDVTWGSSMQLGFPLNVVSRVFRKRFGCRVEEV